MPSFHAPRSGVFYNAPSDVSWLRETHLKGPANLPPFLPPFASFVLHGNEDYPDKLDLYASRDPLLTDVPVTWIPDRESGWEDPTVQA